MDDNGSICFFCSNDNMPREAENSYARSSNSPHPHEPNFIWGTFVDQLDYKFDDLFTKSLSPYFGAVDVENTDQY